MDIAESHQELPLRFPRPLRQKLDFCLLKVSGAGSLEWQQTFGAEGWEGQYESGPSVIQLRNGDFLLVGSSDSHSLIGKRDVQVYVVRMNSRGKKLWEKVFGDPAGFDVGATAVELNSGGIIVGGTRNNFRQGNFLAKLSDRGEVLWEVTSGEHHGDGNLPLLLTDGGEVIAATGYWYADRVVGYILKIDPDGRIIWEFRGVDTQIGRVLDLQPTGDRGLIALCRRTDKSRGRILVKLP